MEVAFEHIASRFDRMLGRLYKGGDTQRGLIVLDKSTYETSLQGLATTFRTKGHQWGQLHNLSEVPLFVDSKATRMVQFADLGRRLISAQSDSYAGEFDHGEEG
jgi:hypothetical protein